MFSTAQYIGLGLIVAVIIGIAVVMHRIENAIAAKSMQDAAEKAEQLAKRK